jgi:serine/threonine protein kinase
VPLAAGEKVGRYTISRLIAQGGMAEVYKAEQDLTGGITRSVAVKVIRPEYSESPDFREMFLDEARTACTLSHPNIAHIYEVGESDEGLLFMVMELVPGETLATINRTLRDNGERFSDEALFAIGIATCGALEAAHALKVEDGTVNLVHRDVSPHNLLLSPTGALKLIDFGIAKAATNRNLTMPGITKGKAGYFSPEQAMGKLLDGRSDLFSLGVTLYKLASGETPFDEHPNHAERHAALVRGQWKPLEDIFAGLPRGFYSVIRKSLALKPEHRFATATEMREALETAAFESQVRVGQSTLKGFVDDDGEITAAGGSRSASFAALAISAPPTSTQRHLDVTDERDAPSPDEIAAGKPLAKKHPTERLSPAVQIPEKNTPKWWLVAALFMLALAVGGSVVLVISKQKPIETPVEKPTAATVAKPIKIEVPTTEIEIAPGVDTPSETFDASTALVRTEIVHKVDKKPVKTKAVPDAAPPVVVTKNQDNDRVEVEIPAGEGKLRIGGIDDLPVTVDGKNWGITPVNKSIGSGRHKVIVTFPDGATQATTVTVMPDQTSTAVISPDTKRWNR